MTLLDINKVKNHNRKILLKKTSSLVSAEQNAKEVDEEYDRKRSARVYVRKTPTKQEKDLLELDAMLNYSEIKKQVKELEALNIRKEDEWDVKIGDPIEYFDPDLSYELTGYRPITATEGLDFDPKLFTVAADTYKSTGRYTSLLPGTFAHRRFWLEEFRRCRDGYTVGKYTLTGDNYFWLNYYRMLSAIREKGLIEKRIENFPGFINKQYEYFHYLELCRKLELDGVVFKGRAVGCSEIASSICASLYTFHEASRHVITAFSETYVTRTLNKIWQELDFLNSQTEGAFKHLRHKINTSFYKRASKVDKKGNESGWKAEIEGIVSDSPRKLRGDRTNTVFFEESGQNVCLIDTYTQGEALVAFGGIRTGSRFVFGTSDSSGPALAGLKEMFYNPKKFSALPYKNKYMRNGNIEYTGYFIPSFSVFYSDKLGEDFSKRGVVNEEVSKAFYNAEFDKVKNDKNLLLRKRAEFCFSPEDGFILEGSNAFNTEKLAEQQVNIDSGITPQILTMRLKWSLTDDGLVDRHSTPIPEFGTGGNIRVIEKPLLDGDGLPYKNLYVGAIDSIDTSSDTTTGQTDLSNFCIVIYKRAFGIQEPKVVAIYKHRPNQISDAYDTAIKLALYYNAKLLVEATRVGVIEYFKNHGLAHWLMRKPSSITSGKNSRQYGVPADTKTIERQLLLINDYVENYYNQIAFPEMIDELLRYSFENKRKFDIVAAFGIALLADEEMFNLMPIVQNIKLNKVLSQLGYYKNEYGLIVYGVVPEKKPEYYGGLSSYGRH